MRLHHELPEPRPDEGLSVHVVQSHDERIEATVGQNVTPPKREPFKVRCKPCGYQWTAAYTPMPMTAMAELLKGLHCPICGGDSAHIFFAQDVV